MNRPGILDVPFCSRFYRIFFWVGRYENDRSSRWGMITAHALLFLDAVLVLIKLIDFSRCKFRTKDIKACAYTLSRTCKLVHKNNLIVPLSGKRINAVGRDRVLRFILCSWLIK